MVWADYCRQAGGATATPSNIDTDVEPPASGIDAMGRGIDGVVGPGRVGEVAELRERAGDAAGARIRRFGLTGQGKVATALDFGPEPFDLSG